jgi:hypothetical protein
VDRRRFQRRQTVREDSLDRRQDVRDQDIPASVRRTDFRTRLRAAKRALEASRDTLTRTAQTLLPMDQQAGASMADNLKQTGKADDARINLGQDHEVNYWANELGVSRDELRSAVAKAGPMVKDVRAHLQHRT